MHKMGNESTAREKEKDMGVVIDNDLSSGEMHKQYIWRYIWGAKEYKDNFSVLG